MAWRVADHGAPRQLLLAGLAAAFALRFAFMMFVLLQRRVPWWEALCTGAGCAALFPLLVAAAAGAPPLLCAPDLPALALHVAGSCLTSGSELQRWRFKRALAKGDRFRRARALVRERSGRGRGGVGGGGGEAGAEEEEGGAGEGCFTAGLFSLAKHINYTGEVLCFLGWAMLTARPAALAAPAFFALALAFFYAPNLDAHLERKYGAERGYQRWRAPAFAPGWLLCAAAVLCVAHVVGFSAYSSECGVY